MYHVINVDENSEKPKKLPKNLAKSFAQLSKIGIQEGILSANDDFRPMLDKIVKNMFPLQDLTEVNKYFLYT